jgi:DUF1365 family protein
MTPSPIFFGKVRHRRSVQKSHSFSYQVHMFYFNIAELEATFKPFPWISVEKFNLFSFYRKNYLGNKKLSLDQAAREVVREKLGFTPQGKIFLLTNLSCLGYCVNPISLYFVFKENSEELELILAEVTNTPWGESHVYVLHDLTRIKNRIYRARFKKELHVSPFLTMNYDYQMHVKLHDNKLFFHVDSFQKNEKHFDATLSLQAPDSTLKWAWWHPFMTLKVTLGIYWQALRLFFKRVTFYSHPGKLRKIVHGNEK